MKRLSSLRSRLLLLVLVAVLPGFALTLYTHMEHQRAAVAVAEEEALRIARIAASEQNDVFKGARQLAFTLCDHVTQGASRAIMRIHRAVCQCPLPAMD